MPKFLTIPTADGDSLANARIHNSTTLSGLTNGTSYRAYLLSEPSSAFVPESAVLPPPAPTVTPTVGASEVSFAWSSAGATGISIDLGALGTLSGSVSPLTLSPLPAAGTYSYSATATGPGGTSPATTGSFVVEEAPAGDLAISVQPVLNRVYQRTSAAGGDAGKGQASVPVQITATEAGPLFARLRNADTDAVAKSAWSVGSVVAGANSVTVTGVPADTAWYYLDVAPSASGPWTLGTNRFTVGRVIAGIGQSQLGRLACKVDTSGASIASLVPDASPYTSVRAIYTGEGFTTSSTNAGWRTPEDGTVYASAGAPELLRRQVAEHGVACAFVGYGRSGGVVSELNSGTGRTAMRNLLAETGAWEALIWYIGGSDAVTGTTAADYLTTAQSVLADTDSRNAYAGSVDEIFLATGTRYATDTLPMAAIRGAVRDLAIARGGKWVEPRSAPLFDTVHPSQAGNAMLGADLHRGFDGAWNQPVLTGASRAGAVITLSFTTSDGAAMVASGSPVARVGVFPSGAVADPFNVVSVTASGTNVTVTLSSDPLVAVDVWLYPHPDSAAILGQFIGDNYTGDGYDQGRPAQMSVAPITIPASGEPSAWLFEDTFQAETYPADLAAHTSDTGQGYTIVSGTATIYSAGVMMAVASALMDEPVAGADVVVEQLVYKVSHVSSLNSWLLARCSADLQNRYQAGWSSGGNNVTIGKTIAGTYTAIQTFSTAPLVSSEERNMRFEVEGSSLRVYVGGVLVGEVTDTDLTEAGYVGLRGTGTESSTSTGLRRRRLRASPFASAPGV